MARTAFDDPKQDLYKHKGDDEWLAKQWAGYNKKFFGGKLKKPKEIYWIRGGKALGASTRERKERGYARRRRRGRVRHHRVASRCLPRASG